MTSDLVRVHQCGIWNTAVAIDTRFTDMESKTKTRLEIIGLVKEHVFHIAKSVAEALKQKFKDDFLEPQIHPLLELDWLTYLSSKKRELRGDVLEYSSSLMCFVNGQLLGNDTDLINWAEKEWNFTFTQARDSFKALAEESYITHLKKTGHQFVFMDIMIAGEAVGRLLFELFSDVCPKTSKNFEALCTGECGLSQTGGFPLCYKGSLFHRIVSNGWVQGGDISTERRGDGGQSIYGPTFEDECFAIPHLKRGTLGMANKGPHTNGSQFYITLGPTPWMDRTYVAFGQVVEGADVLKKLEESPTYIESPKDECRITDCGVLTL
ncbi:putative inactive peptidyl-prolyl cis-trans isomerase-like 6 isoform X2 [Gouania willdenowi]|uniref:PPIase cyclophilin-type domain-containing protein n=1 Tax=Gouania willdenowi TaxID=441366 RepID=A0A8C5DJD3_GOUWI|nr:probable inactive peptidyl-prolyl cis-trans isomerase-like 6 isoform X2 [Gouania willdenowi]